ncbi:MAG: hypothetical protein QNK37_16905 [Acidobacteriota bacterium]|nr:hypothetical protein [Acidobacteriota bacterium]
MSNHLKDLICKIARRNIDFVVGGGTAVILHGVERLTLDLDIAVDMQEDNLRAFLAAMKDMGFRPRAPVPARVLLDADAVDTIIREKNALVFTFIDPDRPYKQIDVFLAQDHRYPRLIDSTDKIKIDGLTIRVLNKRKLIELKKKIRPMRDKDHSDIEELSRLLEESAEVKG